jgi:ribosomal protein S18 acetylase RimI-like enzyme
MPASILPAHAPPLLDDVRALFGAYAVSLPFDLGFQGFDDELASLPGDYAPPRGALLVARVAEASVGCVALRPLDGGVAELKRLYVRPEGRGTGAGRALTLAAIDAARAAGYVAIRLDTTPGMETAQALYESLGFVEIPPYRHNPVPGTRYLELRLS